MPAGTSIWQHQYYAHLLIANASTPNSLLYFGVRITDSDLLLLSLPGFTCQETAPSSGFLPGERDRERDKS